MPLKGQKKREYYLNKYKSKIRKYKEYLGGECHWCGDNRFNVLEFHHLRDKKYNITQGYYRKDIYIELNKCILLCTSCHKYETNYSSSRISST